MTKWNWIVVPDIVNNVSIRASPGMKATADISKVSKDVIVLIKRHQTQL